MVTLFLISETLPHARTNFLLESQMSRVTFTHQISNVYVSSRLSLVVVSSTSRLFIVVLVSIIALTISCLSFSRPL